MPWRNGRARPRSGHSSRAARQASERGRGADRAGMSQFLGTHTNRLDAKGRVSIPAPFRAALRPAAEGAPLVLRPSHKHPCVEGWPAAAFQALAAPLDELDMFGEAHLSLIHI